MVLARGTSLEYKVPVEINGEKFETAGSRVGVSVHAPRIIKFVQS